MVRRSSLSLTVQVLVTVVLFLFAIQLLGSAVDTLSPFLRRNLERIIVGDWSALGVSWVASYLLANGSVVAALSLTLFNSELIASSQLFLMIVGSRLGGAAIVVFIGAFDYLNEEIDSLSESVSLGLLTFLLTHTIYVPVLVIGYFSISLVDGATVPGHELPDFQVAAPNVLSAGSGWLIGWIGAGLALLVAIGLIFLSMKLFDRILDGMDKQRLRRRYLSKLTDKWTSFGIGLVFTGLTTSVAFSLGVIVPLYNRGHVKRDEIVPYVLGANVGTLVDTLIVAVALDTTVGVLTVALLLAIGLVVSALSLAFYATYMRGIDAVQNTIVNETVFFVGFFLSLLIVPVALVIVRWLTSFPP